MILTYYLPLDDELLDRHRLLTLSDAEREALDERVAAAIAHHMATAHPAVTFQFSEVGTGDPLRRPGEVRTAPGALVVAEHPLLYELDDLREAALRDAQGVLAAPAMAGWVASWRAARANRQRHTVGVERIELDTPFIHRTWLEDSTPESRAAIGDIAGPAGVTKRWVEKAADGWIVAVEFTVERARYTLSSLEVAEGLAASHGFPDVPTVRARVVDLWQTYDVIQGSRPVQLRVLVFAASPYLDGLPKGCLGVGTEDLAPFLTTVTLTQHDCAQDDGEGRAAALAAEQARAAGLPEPYIMFMHDLEFGPVPWVFAVYDAAAAAGTLPPTEPPE